MFEPLSTDLHAMGRAARLASRHLAALSTTKKNSVLSAIAEELERRIDLIMVQNAIDLQNAQEQGMDEAILDRLTLTEERIADLAADVRRVAVLQDPVGMTIESRVLENGLWLSKRRVPIGVLGVIYEARPNVTIDVATLCLKTSNAVILRGGSETLRSNLILVKVIQVALAKMSVPLSAVQYIENPSRVLVGQLLKMDEYVDMIIPRGGGPLHKLCRENSTIPVITGGIGICHIFVDESANLTHALDIVENAKVQRPSVCNALDTLLVHEAIVQEFIPSVIARLGAQGVEFRVTQGVMEHLQDVPHEAKVVPAGPKDFDTEWLSLILGIKIVKDLDEAIDHIQEHSTAHSESIITQDENNAERFVAEVDSAAVYVNASTRFTDGGQFGLGAEVAISTQKLHARGPMGLEELTSYKWVCVGEGHVRP